MHSYTHHKVSPYAIIYRVFHNQRSFCLKRRSRWARILVCIYFNSKKQLKKEFIIYFYSVEYVKSNETYYLDANKCGIYAIVNVNCLWLYDLFVMYIQNLSNGISMLMWRCQWWCRCSTSFMSFLSRFWISGCCTSGIAPIGRCCTSMIRSRYDSWSKPWCKSWSWYKSRSKSWSGIDDIGKCFGIVGRARSISSWKN